MKMIDDVIIIGIDSGYGNIKTANCCFPASLSAYDKEPVFKENLLVFEGKFYLIGEGHKEFLADKTKDLDYYVLALAAIARELNIRKMTCGKIRIAAGLPLTWVSGQRDEFRDYLLQNKAVDFSFRNVSYHVEIVGVDVFPQGFAAVADRLSDFRGVNMICDIGNGTMNIMFINDKKPVSGNMFTEKYGTHQCLLAVRENVMRAHHTTVDEAIINRVFRFGTADIKEEYLKTITDTATDYVEGIFQRLREHEYNPELMRLYYRQYAAWRETDEGGNREIVFGKLEACSDDDTVIFMECSEETSKELKKDCHRRQYIRDRNLETSFQVISYSTMTFHDADICGEDVLEDKDCNVEEEVVQSLDIERVRTALKALTPEERDIIMNFYFSENPLSGEALAEKFATTKSSIYRRRDHALRKLKSILGNA